MKARDLNVGNLVTDEFFDSFSKVIIVESINDKGINLEIQNSDDYPELQRHWIEPEYTFEQLRGIPLTEKWLLKLLRDYKDYGIWNNGDAIYFSYGFEKSIKLLYVHQLQNLYFALTNTELEIKQ